MTCERCEEEEATVKVSVTDLDGVVLVYEKWCAPCAQEVGFDLGPEFDTTRKNPS